MFKAMNNLKDRKGFTLIELLIVIAIIGILAAIAIPAFLGQREKARQRALESSCRGAVTEVQTAIDDLISGTAMVFLSAPDVQSCYQSATATAATPPLTRLLCSTLYPDVPLGTPSDYANLTTVLGYIVAHHNLGKQELSPYTGGPLFATSMGAAAGAGPVGAAIPAGQCIIVNSSERTAKVQAYSDTSILLLNTAVSSL